MVLLFASLAAKARPADLAAVSLSTGQQPAYPETIKAGPAIGVDLSKFPSEATAFRAVLRPGRNDGEAACQRNAPVHVTVAGSDDHILLLPPRFDAFDVTEAVRKAVQSGAGKTVFRVVSFLGYQPIQTRLDVTAGRLAGNRSVH